MHASSRLHLAWRALYAATAEPPAPRDALLDAQGRTRALVMALARPAEWAPLAAVWHAVQTEAGLPAPGIAVSGTDSFQLWFSLADAVPVAEAHAFLDALRRRCLGDIDATRVTLMPSLDTAPTPQATAHHASPIPAQQGDAEQWSAYVAPDLAPMFNGAPWLDLPPNPEGQAELLSRLRSITPDEWRAAQAWLKPTGAATLSRQPNDPHGPTEPAAQPGTGTASPVLDPHTFLSQVMNDASVPLALRIEAAKALLLQASPAPGALPSLPKH